jgi:hypothetical protein
VQTTALFTRKGNVVKMGGKKVMCSDMKFVQVEKTRKNVALD